jgi:hypothetical protein
VNVPVVFRMKIKISKSRLSLLISGIICLNLLKNNIFEINTFCDPLALPVTRIGDAIHILKVLIGD